MCPQEVIATAGLRRSGVHFLTLRRSVVPRDSGMPNFCLLNCLGNKGEFGGSVVIISIFPLLYQS